MPHVAKHAALQKRLGYTFRNPALLFEALTHPSYLQDHPQTTRHNQRLEFLGDAVLHFVLSHALYHAFPDEREGVLSRRRAALSKGGFLSRLAHELALAPALLLARNEEDAGGRERDSILEDALESIIGAIYLDSDLPTAQQVVLKWYGPLEQRLVFEHTENPKGRLQELIQPDHGNGAVRYEVSAAKGPKHAREYEVTVFLQDRPLGVGHGRSKKVAEEDAARAALATLGRERGKPE